MHESGGGALAVVKRLRSLDPREQFVLILQYPMARAMAPYRVLMGILLVLAALGLAALLASGVLLAMTAIKLRPRVIVQPIVPPSPD